MCIKESRDFKSGGIMYNEEYKIAIDTLEVMAKLMKPRDCDYIIVASDVIYTISNTCIKYINTDFSGVYNVIMKYHKLPIFLYSDLKKYKKLKLEELEGPIVQYQNNIEYSNLHRRYIVENLNTYTRRIMNNNKYHIKTITDIGNTNERFMNAIQSKSEEGSFMVKLDEEHIVSIFSGLLPILKNDIIDVSIYDIDETTFEADFIIHKKNKPDVNVIVYYYKI